jgi:peptidyl-tRNA hydrolase, PTH1 family
VSIALIVGLGNPGPRYLTTRHNAGFWLVDELAGQAHEQFRVEAKFYGEVCRVDLSSPQASKGTITSPSSMCWLLKPNTFMNRSGQAVVALAHYYKIPVEQILIVHDDLDFPPGTIRLKKGGSDCRHNGLKDIIAHLGSNQFMRLRLGIGHPGHKDQVVNYVLNAPTYEEQTAIEGAMHAALEVIPLIAAGEVNKAMQHLHTNL